MLVYVQDKNGKPLMPTKRLGKVRRWLKSDRAEVVTYEPFTIRLLDLDGGCPSHSLSWKKLERFEAAKPLRLEAQTSGY